MLKKIAEYLEKNYSPHMMEVHEEYENQVICKQTMVEILQQRFDEMCIDILSGGDDLNPTELKYCKWLGLDNHVNGVTKDEL